MNDERHTPSQGGFVKFDLTKLPDHIKKINPKLFQGKDAVKKTKQPNVNEQKCYDEYLLPMIARGVFTSVKFEGRAFKILRRRYTPDYWCKRPDGSEVCFEVKAFWKNKKSVQWHKTRLKIEMVAHFYPDVQFFGIWKRDDEWETERIIGKRIDEGEEK